MKNPSAIGVSVLILIAATTMVGSSSANSVHGFRRSQQTLGALVHQTNAHAMLQSYQRKVDTITLQQTGLNQPHMLRIQVPDGAVLHGKISINNEVHFSLNNQSVMVDLAPYLKSQENQVTIAGNFTPASETVSIGFAAPDTLVQQQIGSTGRINYQLNLMVE